MDKEGLNERRNYIITMAGVLETRKCLLFRRQQLLGSDLTELDRQLNEYAVSKAEIDAKLRRLRFVDYCNTPCWRFKC